MVFGFLKRKKEDKEKEEAVRKEREESLRSTRAALGDIPEDMNKDDFLAPVVGIEWNETSETFEKKKDKKEEKKEFDKITKGVEEGKEEKMIKQEEKKAPGREESPKEPASSSSDKDSSSMIAPGEKQEKKEPVSSDDAADWIKQTIQEIEAVEVNKGVIEASKNVTDPELNIDIWTLGLIYNVNVKEDNTVDIKMTFTSPMCPFGPQIVQGLKNGLKEAGFAGSDIEIVFDPPWEPSDEVKEILGVG